MNNNETTPGSTVALERTKELNLSTAPNKKSGGDTDEVTSFSVTEMTERLEQADQIRQQIRKLTVELQAFGLQLRQKNGY